MKDPQAAFVKGWVVEDLGGNSLLVQCDDDTVQVHPRSRENSGAHTGFSNAKSMSTQWTK